VDKFVDNLSFNLDNFFGLPVAKKYRIIIAIYKFVLNLNNLNTQYFSRDLEKDLPDVYLRRFQGVYFQNSLEK